MLLGVALFVVAALAAYLGAQRATNPKLKKVLLGAAVVLLFALAGNLLNWFLPAARYDFETTTPGPPTGSAMVVREVRFPVTAPGDRHHASWTGGEMPFRIVSPGGVTVREGRAAGAEFTPDAEGNWVLRLEIPATVDTMRIKVQELR